MTQLGKILYLSRADVEHTNVSMSEVIDALAVAFREHGLGHTEMPPKPGIHTQPDAFIHAMPAYIPALHSAGLKWVGGYPTNQAKGLPYISGLLILNDDETGIPLAVMDCSWITAMRTGAASALSARSTAGWQAANASNRRAGEWWSQAGQHRSVSCRPWRHLSSPLRRDARCSRL